MTRSMSTKFNFEDRGKLEPFLKFEESNPREKVLVCNFCGKTFRRKSNLTKHINSLSCRLKDGKDGRRQNICNICRKSFTEKKNLLKHLRDVHKNYKEAEQMVVKKLKCPDKGCKFMCRMMNELREHIEKGHNTRILRDTLQFSNEAEFQKWKKEEETSTVSWFVTGRKKTFLTDGTRKQTLCCHRTGHYNPKGYGKYRMRSAGSCKIGVTCPAAMEIREAPNGHVTVTYYKTHLGHEQDVVYLKLSSEERAELAEKIEQGFTLDAILEDAKESSEKNAKKKRIQMLSKRDLYSIMRTANNNGMKTRKRCAEKKKEIAEALVDLGGDVAQQPLGNSEVGKQTEIQQNITVYPAHGVFIPDPHPPLGNPVANAPPNIPQPAGEGVAPQIVILSPEIEYGSVAEIILLSPGDTAAPQPALIPPNNVPSAFIPSTDVPPTGEATGLDAVQPPPCKPIGLSIEEKNKMNRSKLRRQLKEKIDRIIELLPRSEHLTPKQFDAINVKLDGVVDIFNAVKMGRYFSRKKPVKRMKAPKDEEEAGGEGKRLGKRRQEYETPPMYTVIN